MDSVASQGSIAQIGMSLIPIIQAVIVGILALIGVSLTNFLRRRGKRIEDRQNVDLFWLATINELKLNTEFLGYQLYVFRTYLQQFDNGERNGIDFRNFSSAIFLRYQSELAPYLHDTQLFQLTMAYEMLHLLKDKLQNTVVFVQQNIAMPDDLQKQGLSKVRQQLQERYEGIELSIGRLHYQIFLLVDSLEKGLGEQVPLGSAAIERSFYEINNYPLAAKAVGQHLS